MNVTTPEWLVLRGGAFRETSKNKIWVVLFDGEPQYRLNAVPAAGKFGCAVTQSVNGKRLDKGGTWGTPEEALRGGLEDLRAALGW